jgi:hypothetical protein
MAEDRKVSLASALQRLNADLARSEETRDESQRAQQRAATEQRWLNAARGVFGS